MLTRATSRDEGMSVVELVVAMVVTSVLLAAVATALVGVLRAYGRVQDTGLADDRGRAVADRLDRDFRQVQAVNLPRRVANRWYLEYATNAMAGSSGACTQWRFDADADRLDVRTWSTGTTTAPGWGTAASSVVNDPTSEAPFTVTLAGGAAAHQSVALQLRLQLRDGSATTRASVVARNSSTSSPSNVDADGDGASDTEVCTTFGRP